MLSLIAPAALWAGGETGDSLRTLRGRLIASGDETIRLRAEDGKVVPLVVDHDNFHALGDPRLAERLWELEGSFDAGGRFEVLNVFTLKDAKRFRVTYYCEICHIVSYRPGRCMCCQEEVELREVPVEK